MGIGEDIDQLQVLEDKVDGLIKKLTSLRAENHSLSEKVQIQEERLGDLTTQIETLKSSRDQARQKIVTLLEKIEQLDI